MSRAPRRWQVLSTIAIILLASASSLLGLVWSNHYREDPTRLARWLVQDAIMLGFAVPVLAVGLWLAKNGSARGRIVWLGTLAFMTYMWVTYALQLAFNRFFLGYVTLFALSLFTLIGGLVQTDARAIHRRVHDSPARPLYGLLLGGIALGLAALWLSEIVPAVIGGWTPGIVEAFGHQTIDTYVIDLGVVVPGLAITAVWVYRARPWGSVLAGVMLVFAAVLAPNLTAITFIDVETGVDLSTGMILGTVLPPVVGVGLAAKFLHDLGNGPEVSG